MNFPDPVALAVPAFALLVLVELIYGKLTGRVQYETRDMTASLTMGVGNLVMGVILGGLVVGSYQLAYDHRLATLGYGPIPLLLCFFAEDFSYYWFHRISHERRWFWASHVVHHSSQHYNLSTALRQTWTGKVSFTFVFWIPMVWIGFPPDMVLFFSGVSLVYQFWIHTEAIDRLGPLEWVFNTPSHHRVHHGTNPRYLDANYAGVLIIWDRLFGTFVEECRDEPPTYGIIKRIGTFNPLRIALHEWVSIAQDLRQARSLQEVWGFLFAAPGWRPDGSGKTAAEIKAEWYTEQRSP